MKHVSIVGSCLLRDVFNSKFVPGWSKVFEVDSYFARTTMPSIVSAPLEYDLELLEKGFSALKFEYHYTESAKCMLQILENNASDYLLLDFYADAYYGTYLYQGNYYGGWSFGRLLKQQVIDRNEDYKLYNFANEPEEYFDIWYKAFDKFMAYAGEHFPGTRIVVNGIKGSNQITRDGKLLGIQRPEVDIAAINSLWKKFDDYVKERYRIPVLQHEQEYTLDPDYIYGLNDEFVHFHNAYYISTFQMLKDICTLGNDKKYLSGINLIRNSDFKQKLKYWSFANCKWEVTKENDKYWISPVSKRQLVWRSIWCDPIEINGDGETEYEISLRIKLKQECEKKKLPIVGYRTFKRAVSKKKQESIDRYLFMLDIKQVPVNEEYKCTFQFKPKGKFIRIAPHVQKGIEGIMFTDIQVKKRSL